MKTLQDESGYHRQARVEEGARQPRLPYFAYVNSRMTFLREYMYHEQDLVELHRFRFVEQVDMLIAWVHSADAFTTVPPTTHDIDNPVSNENFSNDPSASMLTASLTLFFSPVPMRATKNLMKSRKRSKIAPLWRPKPTHTKKCPRCAMKASIEEN